MEESQGSTNGEGDRLPLGLTVVALVASLLVSGLTVYCYQVGATALQDSAAARNADVAYLTRGLVEGEFDQCVRTLRALAEGPAFVAMVDEGDEDAVRAQLGAVIEAHPRLGRAFVTDPDGLLWSDYPKAPESLRKSFAHRDWFRGVSSRWEPYVSRVYRRHAAPRLLLVAVAVPIRANAQDRAAGALVCQLRLEGVTALLQELSAERRGTAFLVDHAGKLVAHPDLDLQERAREDYATVPPVVAARQGGGAQGVEYQDPISGARVIATSVPCRVGDSRWALVLQRPAAAARWPRVALAIQTGAAGLLALLLLGLLLGLQRRGQKQVAALVEELRAENSQRRSAEAALQQANETLEARVAERTEELKQTQAQLLHAQKLEAVGRLAGGVAHDFNNLLTVILGVSELELSRLEPGSTTAKAFGQILSAGERAAHLTRQLLAFSRKQVLQPRELDVGEVVQGIEDLVRRLLGEDIDLVVKTSGALDLVLADAGQIEQIVMNLAVNARDAMPEGGKLTIQTANVVHDEDYAREHADAQPGPHVLLAVSDTGVGMDAETREKIFEPYFTTKALGRGTGLGLSTVYGIVKQSGGNIWVYSELGHGTTFKVYLPRSPMLPAPEPVPERRAPRPITATTILVVEDEPLVRGLIQEVLEQSGHTVLAAGDGEEARRLYAEQPDGVALLLTDVVLPGESGRRLAESLRGEDPALKVLYMSGYTDDAMIRHGVLEAGVAFLEKPLTPTRLLEKVQSVLEGP